MGLPIDAGDFSIVEGGVFDVTGMSQTLNNMRPFLVRSKELMMDIRHARLDLTGVETVLPL